MGRGVIRDNQPNQRESAIRLLRRPERSSVYGFVRKLLRVRLSNAFNRSPSLWLSFTSSAASSVADAACFRRVADIVAARPEPRRLIVVSAMSGMTDTLVEAVRLAAARDDRYKEILDGARANIIARPSPSCCRRTVASASDCGHRSRSLRRVRRPARRDAVARPSRDTIELGPGYGEVWSAQILDALLEHTRRRRRVARRARRADGRAHRDGRRRRLGSSRERIAEWAEHHRAAPTLVITGFVASTERRRRRRRSAATAATTARRSSAALLGADEIHIWTDVDGVMSAESAARARSGHARRAVVRRGDGARVLRREGHSSEHDGARGRARASRSTSATRSSRSIRARASTTTSSSAFPVKGLATIERVALLNLEGTGMIGVPGTAQRLFGALRDEGISVVMISQGSSEHSICFAVPAASAERARTAVERAFFAERHHGQIRAVDVTRGLQHPRGRRRRHGRHARRRRAVLQLARQGGRQPARDRAGIVGAKHLGRDRRARTRHARCARRTRASTSRSRRSRSGLVGAGNVGRTLLRAARAPGASGCKSEFDLDLRVRAIATSKRMLLSEHADRSRALAGAARRERRGARSRAARDARARRASAARGDRSTARRATTSRGCYGTWLARGIHVITPNKRANTGSLELLPAASRARIAAAARTTCTRRRSAPALPIIRRCTISCRPATRSTRSKAFSRARCRISSTVRRHEPFSALVREARAARLHRARSARRPLGHGRRAQARDPGARDGHRRSSLSDVAVESLVPEALQSGSVDEFLAALPEHDAEMEARRREAAERGEVLRFVGSRRPRWQARVASAVVSRDASVRAHSVDGQHRVVPHGAVSGESAGGAGARRGTRGDRGGRVCGSVAVVGVSGRAGVARFARVGRLALALARCDGASLVAVASSLRSCLLAASGPLALAVGDRLRLFCVPRSGLQRSSATASASERATSCSPHRPASAPASPAPWPGNNAPASSPSRCD